MKIPSDTFTIMSPETDETMIQDDNLRNQSQQDPLGGIGNEITETFYRVQNVVFAEPLHIERFERNSSNMDDIGNGEVYTIDNVTVEKRPGRKNNKYHIVVEDVNNPVCPQPNCNRKFSTMTLLKAHIRKVHCADRLRFLCEHCGAGFPAQYLLARHCAARRGGRVPCQVCHKTLSERTNMAQHLRSHSASRPHACPVCQKRFFRKATMNIHVKSVHRNGV